MSWKFVAAVVFVLGSFQGAWGQSVFEDRNANGVFDGSDLDVTSMILPGAGTYKTAHPVVIAKAMNQTCESCSISIESAKRITVNANVSSKGKGGQIDLQADQIVIKSKVILTGISQVYLNAASHLSIGDTVRVLSTGGGPTYGYGNVTIVAGKIDVGSAFKIDSTDSVDVRATAAGLFVGPKASIISRRSDVGVFAETGISIQSASAIRGASGVYLYSESGSVALGNSKVTSPILVMVMGETVDANFQLFSKPYAIYDDAHPNGLYVTQ
jgi:hypothetical protein